MAIPAFIDGYVDRSRSLEVFSDSTYFSYTHGVKEYQIDSDDVVCFDVRKLYSTGMSKDRRVYDLKLLYSHDGELSRLVRQHDIPSREEFLELERRFSAHTKAITEARMDVDNIPLRELVPDDLRIPYMNSRLAVMRELWGKLGKDAISNYESVVWPVFQDILQVEQSKIRVDVQFVEDALAKAAKDGLDIHEEKYLRHVLGNTKDGFARTRISPVGSKTWRLRVEGGLNCMAIPHGICRRSIISRFDGGKIVVFDFNAIDYRCLVEAVNDPVLNSTYAGQRDFHTVTASLFGDVTPKLRDTTKKITYAHIYGSSIETLQKLTLLSRAQLSEMLRVIDERFAPISAFRKELAEKARAQGYIVTPGGHRVEVDRNDHDGKIVGLFAQTYSSHIFNTALHAVLENQKVGCSKSKVIFTVHDELVVDMHPDELGQIDGYVRQMERNTGFVVKAKEGKNYGEATDGR